GTSQSVLAATDVALANISGILSDMRAAALSVADNVTSSDAKRAVAQQVGQALQQLLDASNQQFRGRYLFAGSQASVRPYEIIDGYVKYHGNAAQIETYADVDLLLATNISGQEVFGGLSSQVL